MFGKMMNSFYYGKSGKGDYSKEDLPRTRWQLFWQTLRVRLSALVRLNLMYFVVWLPAVIIMTLGAMSCYTGLATIANLQAQLEAGEIAQEALAAGSQAALDGINGVVFQTLLLLIPCIAITGPATAGLCYVTRNWARDEHAFVWADFRDAIKENWKQALPTSVITGFVPLVTYVCFRFYGQMAANNAIFMALQAICAVLALLWFMTLIYAYPVMVTYRLKYRDVLRNSFLLATGRLPMSLGWKLLSVLPAAIAAVVTLYTPYFQYALMLLLIYYALIGFALSRFVGASYTNAVFDRYINPKIKGAEVNKGLYTEDDENDAGE